MNYFTFDSSISLTHSLAMPTTKFNLNKTQESFASKLLDTDPRKRKVFEDIGGDADLMVSSMVLQQENTRRASLPSQNSRMSRASISITSIADGKGSMSIAS